MNGRLFQAEELVFGDLVRIGPFSLRFDGRSLRETTGISGARLDARELKKDAMGVPILAGVSLSVAPCPGGRTRIARPAGQLVSFPTGTSSNATRIVAFPPVPSVTRVTGRWRNARPPCVTRVGSSPDLPMSRRPA